MRRLLYVFVVMLAGAGLAPAAQAAGNISCELRYDLSGWSLIYKTASGNGTISCDNGARIPVRINVRGGGLTVGKSKIVDGRGQFTGAYTLDDLFGTYAAVGAHAGAVRSSGAQAMTKGDISLALAGTGKGWDLGVDGAAFTISRR
ncbi:hypothetical protein RZA67_06035 [Stenotrophomonas sp. C3(2023)]|uniref:hypothetical protein n=1 Tax=Stenotrophomonas sp. C3(2023) TaxID=3080277 RepID=UPI00293C6BFC|nr:hypothetical protein [Stenotrophomonas sp. C3(2023)]MDV3468292.1 hypothetical protein [Stenotrophomonas sp. C3(2023)]